jgi:hypothetical protein
VTARKLTPLEFWYYATNRVDYLKRRYDLSEDEALVKLAIEDGVDLDRLRRLIQGSLPLYGMNRAPIQTTVESRESRG